ncbi:uncharacterized protein TNCV_36541 [Trichonephila clavipes]|nr:uncharacterized protein TNCV_36541 [Trichonephila clavipes]
MIMIMKNLKDANLVITDGAQRTHASQILEVPDLGESDPLFTTVKCSVAGFKRGRTSCHDEHRSGRPNEETSPEMVRRIHKAVLDDHRLKVCELARHSRYIDNVYYLNQRKFINDCTTYAQAIAILDSLFIKKRNVIFARHCLPTRNQQTEETASEYLQILNQLSKDCDFTDVKAEEYRKEYIRDAFIQGLKCPRIRQRLLENTSMTLDQAFEQARTLESAEVHAASYMGSSFPVQSAAMKTEDFSEETVATSAVSSSSRSQTCFFYGNDLYSRTLCPARDVTCRNCGKKGLHLSECGTFNYERSL